MVCCELYMPKKVFSETLNDVSLFVMLRIWQSVYTLSIYCTNVNIIGHQGQMYILDLLDKNAVFQWLFSTFPHSCHSLHSSVDSGEMQSAVTSRDLPRPATRDWSPLFSFSNIVYLWHSLLLSVSLNITDYFRIILLNLPWISS